MGSAQATAPKPSRGIIRASLGDAIVVPDSMGDTWSAAWADDGGLYVSSDDTKGFKDACNSNLAISRLTGDAPAALRGTTVNCMKEFGEGSETLRQDGGMWKACGLTCVDGILYLAVSRHLSCPTEPGPVPTGYWEGHYSPFWIQEAWDASIIKSTDHGKTWSAAPRLGHAMFPGRAFSTPFFVQYRQGRQRYQSDAGQFVYAVSNDGAWNNGNWMVLGRVPKSRYSSARCVGLGVRPSLRRETSADLATTVTMPSMLPGPRTREHDGHSLPARARTLHYAPVALPISRRSFSAIPLHSPGTVSSPCALGSLVVVPPTGFRPPKLVQPLHPKQVHQHRRKAFLAVPRRGLSRVSVRATQRWC